MQVINGNLLDIETGLICHQCNCMGKMEAGLAKSIAKKYPAVKADYEVHFARGGLRLGTVAYSVANRQNDLWVAHLCGQNSYGREKKLYTDYNALAKCFKMLHTTVDTRYDIYLPHGIGCGLAGGDWNIVEGLIEEHLPRAIVVSL